MERFTDFATEDRPLDGEKRRLADLLNIELTVVAFRISESRFKEEPGRKRYMTLQVEEDGTRYVCFTGSEVLIQQIEKYQEHLPFLATIKKVDRYYTFS